MSHGSISDRTCRTSGFCTVAWQLARYSLTRRIARSLGDSCVSCFLRCYTEFRGGTVRGDGVDRVRSAVVAVGLARASRVRRSSPADRRRRRVPGVRLPVLRTDESHVQLPYGHAGQAERRLQTTGACIQCRMYSHQYISRSLERLPRTSQTTVAFCRTLVVAHCGPTPMICGSCS